MIERNLFAHFNMILLNDYYVIISLIMKLFVKILQIPRKKNSINMSVYTAQNVQMSLLSVCFFLLKKPSKIANVYFFMQRILFKY